MAIVGLGGIGKTQLALEFAYKVKTSKPKYSIFWIPALSMESMEQACGNIAMICGIPLAVDKQKDIKELVKEYLSSEAAGEWLLIIDNADDMNLIFGTEQMNGIADYLPQSETGLMLYTTRNQDVAVSLTDSNVIELEQMDRQEAVSFLEQAVIRKQLLDNRSITTELLDELAYLPLAISQCAAYLNRNKNTSFTDYLRLLQNAQHGTIDLLSQEFRDTTRYKHSANAVAKTWLVSFDQIRDRDPVAADLLAFISCIESKAIPLSILPSVEPEERMVRAVGTLCGYSFMIKRGEEDVYDMHRLVHLATGIWRKKYDAAGDTGKKAIRHVGKIFPSVTYEHQRVWRGLITHTLQLLTGDLDQDVRERFILHCNIGSCLRYDGRVRESVPWLEKSYQWFKDNHTEENFDRLESQHELAIALHEDGQFQRSIELLEQVVTVRSRTLPEEHHSLLKSQHELASVYRDEGHIRKAVDLIEHVVAVKGRTLPKEHPGRLASEHKLAGAYREDGQIQKAVKLLEHVVEVENRTVPEEHPDRLTSQNALARTYVDVGEIGKGIELMERVVAVRIRTLPEEHRDRLKSQHSLARAYARDGQIQKAIKLLEHVVAARTRTLPEEQPDRLASQHELAKVYARDGQTRKAVELMEYVVAVQEKRQGQGKPSRGRSERLLRSLRETLAKIES
jgi:tetratricopeptide (TPR) repeat protein